MLTLDASQVSRINLQRFASVVDKELAKLGSETAHSNSLAWGNISTTLAHNLKSVEEDAENSTILNKLRTQTKDVERMRQSSLRAETEMVGKPVAELSAEVKVKVKVAHKGISQTTEDRHDTTAADVASGERIQHLLQDQKDLSAKDLEVEQRTQAMLVNELTELTSMLKDSTIGINRAVKIQNIQLASMGVYAAENRDELEKQKQRMKESTTGMTSSIWTTVWTMLWVVIVFSATYAVIRLLPNRKVYPTCHNPSAINSARSVDDYYRVVASVESTVPAAHIASQDPILIPALPSESHDHEDCVRDTPPSSFEVEITPNELHQDELASLPELSEVVLEEDSVVAEPDEEQQISHGPDGDFEVQTEEAEDTSEKDTVHADADLAEHSLDEIVEQEHFEEDQTEPAVAQEEIVEHEGMGEERDQNVPADAREYVQWSEDNEAREGDAEINEEFVNAPSQVEDKFVDIAAVVYDGEPIYDQAEINAAGEMNLRQQEQHHSSHSAHDFAHQEQEPRSSHHYGSEVTEHELEEEGEEVGIVIENSVDAEQDDPLHEEVQEHHYAAEELLQFEEDNDSAPEGRYQSEQEESVLEDESMYEYDQTEVKNDEVSEMDPHQQEQHNRDQLAREQDDPVLQEIEEFARIGPETIELPGSKESDEELEGDDLLAPSFGEEGRLTRAHEADAMREKHDVRIDEL